MIEIMSKNTGIDSNSFYGNHSNLKRIQRKSKHTIGDENQVPDKKKSLKVCVKEQVYGTPPTKHLSSNLNSTEKFYGFQISRQEVDFIHNGFNNKPLSGRKSGNNRSNGANGSNKSFNQNENKLGLNPSKSVKINMKLVNEFTDDSDTNPVPEVPKELKNNQKITHYFTNKQKPCSPLQENTDKSDEQNINKKNIEFNSSPINVSPDVNNIVNCETPKSWRHMSSDSVNETEINTRLFSSDFNELNENIISDDNIFIDWSETVLEPNIPIGLKNLGNTCYMNSIVQSLFALQFFIEDLEIKFNEQKTIYEQIIDFSMTQKLLNLYNQYNGLRTAVEKSSFEELSSHLSDLKQCVGEKSSPFLSGCQQDAAEFFNYVIDTIAEEFESCQPSDSKNNPIWRNFSFETGGSLVCEKCQNTTQLTNERYNALYLSIPEDKSLQTAFDDFLKDETTGHQCTRCGANRNILSKYFAKRSKVLFLQLARYTQDGSKRTEQVLVPQIIYLTVQSESSQNTIAPSPLATPYRSKLQNVLVCNRLSTVVRKISFDNPLNDQNNDNIENGFENESQIETNSVNVCPQIEDIQRITEENSETNLSKSTNRVKYQLVAVVCHHGISLSVGHYTCYVYSIENNQWFECDDNRITKTDFDCVQKYSQTSGYCYFYVLS